MKKILFIITLLSNLIVPVYATDIELNTQMVLDDYNMNNRHLEKLITPQWVEVTQNLYIDENNIIKLNEAGRTNIYSVWQKFYNENFITVKNYQDKVYYSVTRKLYDCNLRQMKTQMIIYYGKSNPEPIDTMYLSLFSPWSPVEYKTTNEILYNFVCKQ